MWHYEHSLETVVAPEAIWKIWVDVDGWGNWNPDIEKVEFSGPFAAGSFIDMTPKGQDPVRLNLVEVVEHETFVDEAAVAGVTVRTEHRLQDLGEGRTRITYRTEITGSAADEIGLQLGPAITSDFPETMAGLARLAQARS